MKTWIKDEKIPLSLALIYLSMTIMIKMFILYNQTSTESVLFIQGLSIVLIIKTFIESMFLFVMSSYLTQRHRMRAFNRYSIIYIITVPIITFFALLLLQLFNTSGFSFANTHQYPSLSKILSFWFSIIMIIATMYCLALPNVLFFQCNQKPSEEPISIKHFQYHQNILYSLIIFMMILAPLVISYALLFVGFNILIELSLPMIGIFISLTYLYYWHQPLLNTLNDPTMMLHNIHHLALRFIFGYTVIATLLLITIMMFPKSFTYICRAPFSGIAEQAGIIWTYILGLACFIGLFFLSNIIKYRVFHLSVFAFTAIGVTLFLSIKGGAMGFYMALHMVGPALFVLGAFLLVLGLYTRFLLKQSIKHY